MNFVSVIVPVAVRVRHQRVGAGIIWPDIGSGVGLFAILNAITVGVRILWIGSCILRINVGCCTVLKIISLSIIREPVVV